MTNNEPIHVFNTGRSYTAQGQRIAWQVLKREVKQGEGFGGEWVTVAFADYDRMVDGVIKMYGEPDNAALLEQYDRCLYTGMMDFTLREQLREAAAATR